MAPKSSREEEKKMSKQMTPAEIELIHQSFARLAFGVEYNEGGSHAHEKARAAYAKRGRKSQQSGLERARGLPRYP
jgi:hypothetical protein